VSRRTLTIIVNHLTRMKQGYFCVAGIDTATYEHVRPVPQKGNLSTKLLARNGGPFDMAMMVQFENVRSIALRPEVEDHLFNPTSARVLEAVEPGRFWELLKKLAKPKLSELFGPDLVRRGTSACAVDVGKGQASLGCLIPESPPLLFPKHEYGKDKIRMRITDGQFHLDLSVTDIRLYKDDHATPNKEMVWHIARQLLSGKDAIISVGLTRPFAPSSESDVEAVHWLQVNNIHLRDDPAWRLG
jgi:hypothetical protein